MPRSTSTVLVVLVATSMLSSCSGESRRASSPQPSAGSSGAAVAAQPAPRRVRLDVGHCYVEPLTFADERWGLRFSQQFGWGGSRNVPDNWEGAGVLTRVAEDRVLYTDDGGAGLTLLPADSPAVARADAVPCR